MGVTDYQQFELTCFLRVFESQLEQLLDFLISILKWSEGTLQK
jgi:hypothetical protein